MHKYVFKMCLSNKYTAVLYAFSLSLTRNICHDISQPKRVLNLDDNNTELDLSWLSLQSEKKIWKISQHYIHNHWESVGTLGTDPLQTWMIQFTLWSKNLFFMTAK